LVVWWLFSDFWGKIEILSLDLVDVGVILVNLSDLARSQRVCGFSELGGGVSEIAGVLELAGFGLRVAADLGFVG
jgi:hypothetical protein